MIFGVGIDLIEVERVTEKIRKKSGFKEDFTPTLNHGSQDTAD